MTHPGEASELFRTFLVLLVGSWPYVRAVFLVWAIVSVADSLSRIARNLERVVNRWDQEREAGRTPAKPVAVETETTV